MVKTKSYLADKNNLSSVTLASHLMSWSIWAPQSHTLVTQASPIRLVALQDRLVAIQSARLRALHLILSRHKDSLIKKDHSVMSKRALIMSMASNPMPMVKDRTLGRVPRSTSQEARPEGQAPSLMMSDRTRAAHSSLRISVTTLTKSWRSLSITSIMRAILLRSSLQATTTRWQNKSYRSSI